MSTYLKQIEAEYDSWCEKLGLEITNIINSYNPIKIEPFVMGDCIHHTVSFIGTEFDIHLGNIMVTFNYVTEDVLNITIGTSNSDMIETFAISATDTVKIAYENMMLGSHLWHAYQTYLTTHTPNLDDNYNPAGERPH